MNRPFLCLLVLAAAASVAPALAERTVPKRQGTLDPDKPKRAVVKSPPTTAPNATQQAASSVKPIAPESLGRFVPAQAGGFARRTLEPRAQIVGVGVYTTANAELTDSRGRNVRLVIVDTAGVPPESVPEVPAPAESRRPAAGESETRQIGGFPALLETGADGEHRVQVTLAPRLRVLLSSGTVPAGELAGIVSAIDLPALAALAR